MAIQVRNDEQASLLSGDLVQNQGELHISPVTVAANWTLHKPTVYLATGGGAGITGTLPRANLNRGKVYVVKKIDAAAGAVNVQRHPATADLIDGAGAVALPARWNVVRLVSDGVSNWYVI